MNNMRHFLVTATFGLRKLFQWMRVGIRWTLLSAVLWLLLLPFVVDVVALGPWFRWAMLGSLAVAISLSFLLLVSFGPALEWVVNRLRNIHIPSRSRQGDRVLGGVIILVVVGLAAGGIIWFKSHQSKIVADAESAMANFEVNYAKGVDLSRLNQTLAEFERARRSIERVWPNLSDRSPITLRLFGSIEEYHAVTGRHHTAGVAFCPSTGAVVWVPLEQAIELPGEDDHTLTPLHEMVHAIMCQYLGQEAFYSIPRWFHESMAELYENEARHLRAGRATNRFNVWLNGNRLMSPDTFCTEPFMRPESEIGLFYMTVLEFARFLEAEQSRDSLLGVVDDVRNGIGFEDSLRGHFGSTCVELYGNWLESW